MTPPVERATEAEVVAPHELVVCVARVRQGEIRLGFGDVFAVAMSDEEARRFAAAIEATLGSSFHRTRAR